MRKTTPAQVSLFKADWHGGLMISEICQRHTLSRDQVVRLRVGLSLPPRMDRGNRGNRDHREAPTPEEIAARSAEVREKWSQDTERKRLGRPEGLHYEIPQGIETPEDFDPGWYD